MTTVTCDHCDSEIDTAKDPNCVIYNPSGATDVYCAECRDAWLGRSIEQWDELFKRGWQA
jgi:hypothetical protein